ncbi:uncharacterized protein LOC135148438 [Daucus carota subsp. sativus]|uniref:uncharacterized protein LOC135148438 n=1 Tax=Daucus carota subsp. sativus TaxID=79200 RepID=UPI003083DBD9
MDMLPVQQQPQSQQPQPPVSPTIPKQPRTSASRSKKATKSDENPSTQKTRTSVATQVLKTKSDKPANSDAVNFDALNTDTLNSEAASPQKQKRRRLEEQAPSSSLLDVSQALMVHPLQAVPISAATASSTSSEVDEEIVCKDQTTTEAETPLSDSHIPISDHGPSTPIPHSPMKIPEGAIVHDTAPEHYKSDVVEEPDKVAVEALQSLATADEEPSKSKVDDQEKSIQEPVEKIANPAFDNDEDDDSSDDDRAQIESHHSENHPHTAPETENRVKIASTTAELPQSRREAEPNNQLSELTHNSEQNKKIQARYPGSRRVLEEHQNRSEDARRAPREFPHAESTHNRPRNMLAGAHQNPPGAQTPETSKNLRNTKNAREMLDERQESAQRLKRSQQVHRRPRNTKNAREMLDARRTPRTLQRCSMREEHQECSRDAQSE